MADQDQEEFCYICFDAATKNADGTVEPLVQVCKCPTRVHRRCVARWQLYSAGKREEKSCRFCQGTLPDWKEVLTPAALPPAVPVLSIYYNNTCCRMKVRPGPDGLQAFLRQLEVIVGRDVANVNFVFRCRCPDTGAEIFLQGLQAFEAAMHCACVRAAQRSLQQQQQQQLMLQQQQQHLLLHQGQQQDQIPLTNRQQQMQMLLGPGSQRVLPTHMQHHHHHRRHHVAPPRPNSAPNQRVFRDVAVQQGAVQPAAQAQIEPQQPLQRLEPQAPSRVSPGNTQWSGGAPGAAAAPDMAVPSGESPASHMLGQLCPYLPSVAAASRPTSSTRGIAAVTATTPAAPARACSSGAATGTIMRTDSTALGTEDSGSFAGSASDADASGSASGTAASALRTGSSHCASSDVHATALASGPSTNYASPCRQASSLASGAVPVAAVNQRPSTQPHMLREPFGAMGASSSAERSRVSPSAPQGKSGSSSANGKVSTSTKLVNALTSLKGLRALFSRRSSRAVS